MDINRVPNEKKLNLCRWYFRGKAKFFKIYARFVDLSQILSVKIL